LDYIEQKKLNFMLLNHCDAVMTNIHLNQRLVKIRSPFLFVHLS